MKHKIFIITVLLFAIHSLVTLVSCSTSDSTSSTNTPSSAYWNNKKGNCDAVLTSPHAYDVSQIANCTKLWEMYRFVNDISLKDRSMYAVAFSKVSHLSPDPYDRAIADAALARICIPRHPLGSNGEVVEQIPDKDDCNSKLTDLSVQGTSVASNNPYANIKGTVRVKEVSDKDAARAHSLYKKASAERKKNALSKAIKLYEEALDADPFNVAAKYDLACALAVRGDESGALRTLEELYTWDDSEAEQRIIKARTDEDFENIRSNPNFKLMTGYVRIIIVNGAGSLGLNQVNNIKKKLEAKKFPIEDVTKGHRPELVPQIWYKQGFDDYANQIKSILNIDKMVLKSMQKGESDGDILVVWGQPEAATIGPGTSRPVIHNEDNRATGSKDLLKDAVNTVNDTKKDIESTRTAGENLTKW